jgi:hypothetical protein
MTNNTIHHLSIFIFHDLFLYPNARDFPAAEFAASIFYIHLRDKKALPLYQDFLAARTIGVIPRMARNISHVRIVNASAESHVTGPLESGYGSGREIEHLVGGMETGEVQGHIGAAFSQYPVYQPQEHLVGIV